MIDGYFYAQTLLKATSHGPVHSMEGADSAFRSSVGLVIVLVAVFFGNGLQFLDLVAYSRECILGRSLASWLIVRFNEQLGVP